MAEEQLRIELDYTYTTTSSPYSSTATGCSRARRTTP